jgi:hypothetical protein
MRPPQPNPRRPTQPKPPLTRKRLKFLFTLPVGRGVPETETKAVGPAPQRRDNYAKARAARMAASNPFLLLRPGEKVSRKGRMRLQSNQGTKLRERAKRGEESRGEVHAPPAREPWLWLRAGQGGRAKKHGHDGRKQPFLLLRSGEGVPQGTDEVATQSRNQSGKCAKRGLESRERGRGSPSRAP